MTKVVAIIPARYGSSRFPGKPLAMVAGRPMIAHVFERAGRARGIGDVFVATDDRRIYDAVIEEGGQAVMTDPSHPSGTDRIAEVAAGIDCDVVVNVQGDEPFIPPAMIEDAIRPLLDSKRVFFGSLKRRLAEHEDVNNPNLVKVVCDEKDFAIYFSRSPIPYYRDGDRPGQPQPQYYVHVGLYVYRKDYLLKLTGKTPTPLEQAEKLEQLRILENGWRIKVPTTNYNSIGIDTPEDLERALAMLQEKDQ